MCGTQGQLQRSCEEDDSKHHLPPRRLECVGFSAELWMPRHPGNFARRVAPSGLPTRVGLPGQLPEARRPVREFPRRLEAPPGQLSYDKNSAVFVSGSGSTPQTTPEFMLMSSHPGPRSHRHPWVIPTGSSLSSSALEAAASEHLEGCMV